MNKYTDKKMIIFMGASGAGKTKTAMTLKSHCIPELISHTDRDPRIKDKEVHGVHYYFVTKEEFKKVKLAEYAEYSGKHYGLSVKEIEDNFSQYDIVYAITEINGIKQLKAKYGDIITVIYVDIDPEIARKRMAKRGDTEEQIATRMNNAIVNKEYENAKYADYIINNNGTPEETQRQLFEVIEKVTGKQLQNVI